MCSIIGGFEKKKIEKLVEINQHRGNFSYSITALLKDPNRINGVLVGAQFKDFGLYNLESLKLINDNSYVVSHVQSPTGGNIEDRDRIHPTTIGTSNLWHNGMLTSRGIKFLQKKLHTNEIFDTRLLHEAILTFGFEILSEIEGLFACVLIKDEEMFCFRTKHGKLYIDKNFNISSERFPGGKCINYDTIYELSPFEDHINVVDEFKTKKFNVVINGEL